MPTYDYRCAKCGETFEVWQSFSDKPLTKHAGCGGKLSKVMGAAGIVLKGSGFYKNDSGSRSKPAAREKKESVDSGGTDSGATKADATPSSSNGDGKQSDSKLAKSESSPKRAKPEKSAKSA